MGFTKYQRLLILFERLREAPPVSSAEAALRLVCDTLERVEDEYSGEPREAMPARRKSARMYPPQADTTLVGEDGVILAKTVMHFVKTYPDGSLEIIDRSINEIVFKKDGLRK
jgi:hypothetical protein